MRALKLAELTDRLAAEQDRWRYWLPVGLGLGIAVYFTVSVEPPAWIAIALASPGFLLLVVTRNRPVVRTIAIVIVLVAGGSALAQWRTGQVEAPRLAKSLFAPDARGPRRRGVGATSRTKVAAERPFDRRSRRRGDTDICPRYNQATARSRAGRGPCEIPRHAASALAAGIAGIVRLRAKSLF